MTIAAAVIVMAVMGSNGAMVQNETEKKYHDRTQPREQ
jgi:hypothetical protein